MDGPLNLPKWQQYLCRFQKYYILLGTVVVYLASKSKNSNLDLDIVVITSGLATMVQAALDSTTAYTIAAQGDWVYV